MQNDGQATELMRSAEQGTFWFRDNHLSQEHHYRIPHSVRSNAGALHGFDPASFDRRLRSAAVTDHGSIPPCLRETSTNTEDEWT